MKQYVYKGATYKTLPDPLENTSPISEETFIQMGGTIITIETPEEREFKEACRGFRELCYLVRPIVGDPNWRGAIEEIRDALKDPRVVRHPDFQYLSTMLTWYDKECTYLGSKIGLGQPGWWYRCWEYEQEEILAQMVYNSYTGEMEEINPYNEFIELNPYEEELNPYDESEINPYDE